MSCYLRHIKNSLVEAGIDLSPANKKKIDQLIHQLVGTEYKNCSNTWAKVKELKVSEKSWSEFLENLKIKLSEIN